MSYQPITTPLQITDLDAELNLATGITTYRERVMAPRYTVLSDSIADGLASFWTQTTGTGGTITVSAGEGLLQTSAAANGSAQLVSTIPAYFPGQSHWSIAAARFGDTGVANNIRRVGTFTVSGGVPQDGFAFELNGTTFNAVVYKAGVATATPSTSWTKASTAPFTLDANYHLWEERWTGNRVDFYIDNVLRHTVSGTTSPITTTLNFPMSAQNINSTNATNVTLAVRNIGLGRFGIRDIDKVQLTDGTLNVTNLPDGSGGVGLGVGIMATNFTAGPGNTTTTQLASGATYTGTIETIFNQQAISILLTSDQNGTLTLKQYIDAAGTRLASSVPYVITAGVGFSRSIVANGNYFNLTFKNSGSSTTTTLNINAFYGTLPAITNLGNSPVSLDEINGTTVGARPDGFLRTVNDPTTLLFDTFETLDTTNTWTLGGTALPTGANGIMTIAANATVSATSYAVSQPKFTPGSNAYLQFAALVTVDGVASTGTNRFWGLGTITAPTTALPIQNGTIFEVDTTGVLFGSVYSNGARTQTATLTKPTDGLVHRYAIYYKASRAYFELDNVIVGSLPFPNPAVSALNLVIGQANSGTVTGTNTLTATLMGIADTGRNATKMADGLYPWRTATVKPASTAAVATDTPLVVTMHPSSASTRIGNADGSITGSIQPYNMLKTSPEPTSVFFDPFDSAIDTTVRWTTAGTVPPTTVNGNTVFSTATTSSATSYLTSQPTFAAQAPGYIQVSWLARFDASGAAVTQGYRFMGLANAQGAPTQAAPIIDGFGFTIDTDGKMYFDVWASSVRISRTDMSATGTGTAQNKQPLDGAIHRYLVLFRTERIYVYIDSNDIPIISLSNLAPNIQTLPVKFMQINGSTQTTALTFQVSSVAVADTGRNAAAISDGTYAWRKATVKPASTAAVATDPALVVTLSPNSPVTQATLTKGTQGATGVTTQDLKDSGRTHWSATTVIAGVATVTTEAMVTMVPTRAGVSAATTTSQTVTAAKRLRITSMTVGFISTAAAVLSMRFGLRTNNAGAAIVTSPLIFIAPLSSGAALAQAGNQYNIPLPDGLEFSGNDQFGVSQVGSATTGTCWVTLNGFEY